MYLNKNKHILSNAILLVAFLNIISECSGFITRIIVGRTPSQTPAMLNALVDNVQTVVSVAAIIFTSIIFFLAWKKLNSYRKLISPDDEDAMAMLQKEMIPDSISVLSLNNIELLTKIWAAILIGVQIIYELTSNAYQKIIEHLIITMDMNNPDIFNAYVSFYNSSHGFKYIGMLIAIAIGIFTTGVFLKDHFFTIASASLMAAFLICFLVFNASTITLGSNAYGIVWTSVIFHILQTFGLLAVSIYLRLKYRGI